jgi:hypothetical protein
MCAEGPWFEPGYWRGDGLKLYCYMCLVTLYLDSPDSQLSVHKQLLAKVKVGVRVRVKVRVRARV